jgi:hypothetical protein
MKYILLVTAALCLAVPFVTRSTVFAPEPNLIDLTDGALISKVQYHGGDPAPEFRKTVWYDNGLVIRHRKDNTWEYSYE